MFKDEEIDIRHEELIRRMQETFIRRGLMGPVKIAKFKERLGDLIEGHREVCCVSLQDHWQEYFPGVSFSEEVLEEALDKSLKEEQRRQLALFEEKLKRKEIFFSLFGWVFTKGQLLFVSGTIFAVIAAAIFIPLIFVPTDYAFRIGFWGLILDVVLFVVLFGWFIQSLTKRKGGI